MNRYPVIRHRISGEKFIVAGGYFSNLHKRMVICLFPEKEKHYITINGVYDKQQCLVYTNNRFENVGTGTLNPDQTEVLNCHLLNGLIEFTTEVKETIVQSKLNFDNN